MTFCGYGRYLTEVKEQWMGINIYVKVEKYHEFNSGPGFTG